MKKFLAYIAIAALAVGTSLDASAQSWSKYRIMLDPGHGGTDPGASGPSAPHEATLALRCAKTLSTKISNLGGTYKLTRTTDTYISLSARKSACASYDPYIFCSIHLNAANKTAQGTETWYYFSTGNSKPLANKVQASLVNEMGRNNRGVKQNGWTVITASASIPAILTEGLFVDNPTEWGLIKTEGSTGYNNWVNGHLYGFYDHLAKNLNASVTNPRTSSTAPTTNPTITVDASSWTFNCENGKTDTYDFTVTGKDLSAAISIASNNSHFTVNKTSVTKTGGTFTVTFTPTEVGSVTGKITLTSGSVSKTISLTGKATAQQLKFETKWRACDERSNSSRYGWNALNVRNMDYNNGKLYLVYNHEDIKVVDAQKGTDLGNLGKAVVSGGVITLCDVKVVDGKVIASNIGNTDQNKPLKVYIWDNDQAQARLLLETSNFGGAKRLGDCIGFKGTLTNGKLVFVNDDNTTTRLVKYTVKNGVVDPTPAVTNLTTDGTTQLKTSASARAVYDTVNGVEGFWIDGKENYTAFVNTKGERQFYIDSDESWGNAISRFTWQGSEYAVTTVYNPMEGESWSAQTDEQKAKNYTGGRMRLLRNDDTWSKATTIADYPSAGLSLTRQNTNCTSNVITSVTGNVVEAWVLSTNQGIGYYISTGSTAPTYNPTPITPEEPAEPTMSVSPANVSIETQAGTPATANVAVTASDLTSAIALSISGTDASAFTVSETSLSKSTTSANVTVTFNPQSEGTYTATLTLTSGSLSKTVSLTGVATAQPTLNDQIDEMTQGWVISETKGNLDAYDWATNTGNTTRDIQFLNGKLYAANNGSLENGCSIYAVDPYTGTSIKSLSTKGISTGRLILGGVASIGGKLIASNSAQSTHELKVYKWDNDDADPVVWFSDATHGGITVGDQINTSGTMEDGYIWFSNGQIVLRYKVTNGTVNTTAEQITLSDNGTATNAGMADVTPMADGRFWVTGCQSAPKLYEANGTHIGTLVSDSGNASKSEHQGTSLAIINFGSKVIAARTTYVALGGSTITGGALEVLDITEAMAGLGVSRAAGEINGHSIGIYPPEGLGTTRNTQFETAVTYELANNGTKLNIWGCVTLQGVTYCSYDGAVGSSFLRGDVNGDREVNSADLGALINIIIGVAPSNERADVNNDESVTSADLGALINIIIGN